MHQSIHQSIHLTQQFLFQNVFSLFVFFRRLICSIVLPPDNLFALSTVNVAYHVSACRHVTFSRFALLDVYDAVEEIGFPVLAAEVARYDFIVVCEVGFAVFAAVDSFGGQVDVVGEAHVIGSAVSGTATWPGPSRLSVRLDSLLYSFVLRLLRWDLNSVL